MCNDAGKVDCGNGSGFKCPKDEGLFPDAKNCSKFFVCVNDVSYHTSCPEGLHFSPTQLQCDTPERAGCEKGDGGEIVCTENGEFPHPKECTKWVHCSNGKPYVKDCPGGLHFNPKLRVCDWPNRAGCQAPKTAQRGKDTEIIDEEEVTITETSAFKCSENGYFPYPGDCQRMYECMAGSARVRKCPDGLHFDGSIAQCSFPEDVGCEDHGARKGRRGIFLKKSSIWR